jgi:hypothetical protein
MAVSVFLRGGLGNQLFQYAAGLYLSRSQGSQLRLRTDLLPLTQDSVGNASRWPNQICDFLAEGKFVSKKSQPPNRTNNISKVMQGLRMVGDLFPSLLLKVGILAGESTKAPDFSNLKRIWLVNSYCSSAQTAFTLGDDLRSQIRSLVDPSKKFVELLRESKSVNPIIVHLRLGDYRNFPSLYGAPSLVKIKEYLDSIEGSSLTPIWIFTDSPEDVREDAVRVFGNVRIIGPDDLKKPIENMIVMSSGSHLLCANSSFSWWAAFLMGEHGKVHYPRSKVATVNNFHKSMVLESWGVYESD